MAKIECKQYGDKAQNGNKRPDFLMGTRNAEHPFHKRAAQLQHQKQQIDKCYYRRKQFI